MPATFTHCLIAREAMARMATQSALYSGILKMKDNFVVMGATGPDYPYLTDAIKYGALTSAIIGPTECTTKMLCDSSARVLRSFH
jgi:hypothetical protein